MLSFSIQAPLLQNRCYVPLNFKSMIHIESGYAWKYEPFDGWVKCGRIVKGFDGYYIQWFA